MHPDLFLTWSRKGRITSRRTCVCYCCASCCRQVRLDRSSCRHCSSHKQYRCQCPIKASRWWKHFHLETSVCRRRRRRRGTMHSSCTVDRPPRIPPLKMRAPTAMLAQSFNDSVRLLCGILRFIAEKCRRICWFGAASLAVLLIGLAAAPIFYHWRPTQDPKDQKGVRLY